MIAMIAAVIALLGPTTTVSISQSAVKVECRCDRCPLLKELTPELQRASDMLTLVDLVGADQIADGVKLPKLVEKAGIGKRQVADAIRELSRFNKRTLRPFLKKEADTSKSPPDTSATKP